MAVVTHLFTGNPPCARSCSLEIGAVQSARALQVALQTAFKLEGQAFNICDARGNSLRTDHQVREAVAQGLTPFCATLAQTSPCERSQAPFAQSSPCERSQAPVEAPTTIMQIPALVFQAEQLAAVTKQVEALQANLEAHKACVENKLHSLHVALSDSTQEIRERMDVFQRLMDIEWGHREAEILGLCAQAEAEVAAREVLETKHNASWEKMNDQLVDAMGQCSSLVQEHAESVARTLQDLGHIAEMQGQQVLSMRQDYETTVRDAKNRLTTLEARCSNLESSSLDRGDPVQTGETSK